MKTKLNFLVIPVISVVFSLVNLSCQSTKTAVSCPDISIRKNEYKAHRKVTNSHSLFTRKMSFKNQSLPGPKKIKNDTRVHNLAVIGGNRSIQIGKIEFTNSLIASIDNSIYPVMHNTNTLIPSKVNYKYRIEPNTAIIQDVKCDTIILRSGAVIIGKVEEIGQSELKYKRCDNLNGPVISVLKSDVSKIYYSNGTNEFFDPVDRFIPNQANYPSPNYNLAPAKTEGLGLAGFISGVVGLFVASIPLGIVAVVFGIISLSKIKRNPQRFKGKGFSIASIVLGFIDIIAMAILLSTTV